MLIGENPLLFPPANFQASAAAATVLPEFIFYLNSGPLLITLLGLIVKDFSLSGISVFHFTSKMNVSRFMFSSFSFGLSHGCQLLVEKGGNLCFSELPFLWKERT